MRRSTRTALAASLSLAALGGTAVTATPASAAVNSANAGDLATAMDVPTADVLSSSIGFSDLAGVGVADSALAEFPTQGTTFAILSTGAASSADDPDGNNGETVSGQGHLDDTSTVLGGLNNAEGHDLVQLHLGLRVPSDFNCATVDFKFLSEEWPDFFNTQFNDTFTAQVATAPTVPSITVAGSTVTAPDNFAFDTNGDPLSINSGFGLDTTNPNPDTGTTYDGATTLLSASTPVTPGSDINLVFSVTDLGDSILDTAVFLDDFRWGATAEGGCVPGATINDPPVANAGDDSSGDEGAAIALSGSGADPDGDPLTYSWSYAALSGVDAGATCAFADPLAAVTTITCADDGVYEATLTASDGTVSDADTATVTVANAAPVLTLSSPTEGALFPVGGTVDVAGSFTDAGSNDTHTCEVTWDDGSSTAGTVSAGTCQASKAYAVAGVYTISVTVTDDDDGSDTQTVMIVVYDPAAGFVTGGGSIDSPAGAYTADLSLSGKANFGFVSKYKKGATAPDGQTEFQFKAGNFNFHSSSYDWLVVSGPRAQFKGVGTVNGSGSYGFLLTATDGQVSGGGGVDQFRIKVWDIATDTVVYDNKVGTPDDADPQALSGGSIVIHKAK